MPDRVFSEQEIAQILQRAIERQEAEVEKRRARDHGLSLAELERLGSEVGISPEHLRAAASEVHRPGVQRKHEVSDTHNYVERLIPGYLTDAAWGEIVTDLRHQLGVDTNDSISIIGNMHEWSHTSASGISTKATLAQRGNSVALRLSQRVGIASPLTEGVMYGTIAAMFFGFITAAGMDFNFLQGTMLFSAFLVIFSVLIYTLDVAWRKKKHRQIEAIADRIETLVDAESIPVATSTPTQATTAEPRIDLPDEEAPDITSTSTANRIRA
ncbi:MAG: hypothetical protein RhofKO_27590 [Rhodothermales bacterium]